MEIKKRKGVIDNNVKLQIMKKYNFGVADGSAVPNKDFIAHGLFTALCTYLHYNNVQESWKAIVKREGERFIIASVL